MAEYDEDSYDSGVRYDEVNITKERRKIVAKIKRDVKRDTVPNRIAFGQQMVAACTGNPNFTGLTADITALGTQTAALAAGYNAAQAAQSNAMQKTVELNTGADDWNAVAETAFLAIEKEAHGDAAKMLSAKVPVYEPGQGTAAVLPFAPANFVATHGDLDATLDLTWDRQRGSGSYVIQMTQTADVATSWQQIAISATSSYTVQSLTSGQKYWFRVAAINIAGQGPWSDPAEKLAP